MIPYLERNLQYEQITLVTLEELFDEETQVNKNQNYHQNGRYDQRGARDHSSELDVGYLSSLCERAAAKVWARREALIFIPDIPDIITIFSSARSHQYSPSITVLVAWIFNVDRK